MGAYGILQFEKPLPFPYRRPAEENMSLDSYILDLFDTDDLIDIDPQELMLLIFHAKSQRPDISAGRADRNNIHRTVSWLHHAPSLSFSFIIAHSFDNSKEIFLVAIFYRFDIMIKKEARSC